MDYVDWLWNSRGRANRAVECLYDKGLITAEEGAEAYTYFGEHTNDRNLFIDIRCVHLQVKFLKKCIGHQSPSAPSSQKPPPYTNTLTTSAAGSKEAASTLKIVSVNRNG
ncbi:hypothetical protein RI367_008218 [Sorochytrium milnesiophthora]